MFVHLISVFLPRSLWQPQSSLRGTRCFYCEVVGSFNGLYVKVRCWVWSEKLVCEKVQFEWFPFHSLLEDGAASRWLWRLDRPSVPPWPIMFAKLQPSLRILTPFSRRFGDCGSIALGSIHESKLSERRSFTFNLEIENTDSEASYLTLFPM